MIKVHKMSKKEMSKNPQTHKNRNILDLNSSIDQLDLVAIYRIFHPEAAEIKIFSSTHKAFVRIKTT
jgi:hypothetical protein